MEQDELGVWLSPSGARVAWFEDPDRKVLSLTQPWRDPAPVITTGSGYVTNAVLRVDRPRQVKSNEDDRLQVGGK